MPVLAVISGYQGCGKTHLCTSLQATYGHLVCFKDVDAFLPFDGFKDRLDSFIEECKMPLVLFGTFCDDATKEEPYFPEAEHYIWMDVEIMKSIKQALQRQLDAIESGANLCDFLIRKSSSSAKNWINAYLNPHMQFQEGIYQAIRCCGFTRMAPELIESFILKASNNSSTREQ